MNLCSCGKDIFCKNKCKSCYNKDYHSNNKEKILTRKKLYYLNNYEQEQLRNKEYKQNNLDEVRKRYREYYYKNKDSIREKRRVWENKQVSQKTDRYLKHILRSRLRKALKGSYKNGSAVKSLGCSIKELKSHLESKFQPGMTWDNYGKWHIDHIKPLASFNLRDTKELKEACHYSNLQPLWAIDNILKRDKHA